ncbi:MAG: hypothetical protein JST29_02855 [Bacteroidetes bacterium]|nr:hypothetical protein [Bacteroidota bacterium]MBS1591905.1 hypothetical protein [Bacteroidota bacterium]
MNEQQNIDDGLKMEDDSGEQATVDSQSSTETEPQSQPKPKPQPMEVHHHPHVEKKSFKEYLLEGLMIFLAVTMGFIAENIRENIAENHKAQELAENLYQEVKSDSIVIQQKIDLRLKKEKQMVYLRDFLRDSSLENLGSTFGKAAFWTYQVVSTILFEPQDGILLQLKNSNNFKFYKNKELQNAVGKYSVAINRVRTRNEQEYNVVDHFIRQETISHFDYKWQEKVTNDGQLTVPQLINNPQSIPEAPFFLQNKNTFSRVESSGIVSQYLLTTRGTTQLHYVEFKNANHELLEVLRKNYHLEKE